MVDKWINTTVIATESLLTKQEYKKNVCSQQMVAQVSAQLSFVWTILQNMVDLFLLASFKIKFEVKEAKV